jgi:precorrin-3B methylase
VKPGDARLDIRRDDAGRLVRPGDHHDRQAERACRFYLGVGRRAAGSGAARVIATTLADADGAQADMRTLVIVGASTTRQVGRWIYTPRGERGTA